MFIEHSYIYDLFVGRVKTKKYATVKTIKIF